MFKGEKVEAEKRRIRSLPDPDIVWGRVTPAVPWFRCWVRESREITLSLASPSRMPRLKIIQEYVREGRGYNQVVAIGRLSDHCLVYTPYYSLVKATIYLF